MTKMTQGPWTRIRPLQIDEVDATVDALRRPLEVFGAAERAQTVRHRCDASCA